MHFQQNCSFRLTVSISGVMNTEPTVMLSDLLSVCMHYGYFVYSKIVLDRVKQPLRWQIDLRAAGHGIQRDVERIMQDRTWGKGKPPTWSTWKSTSLDGTCQEERVGKRPARRYNFPGDPKPPLETQRKTQSERRLFRARPMRRAGSIPPRTPTRLGRERMLPKAHLWYLLFQHGSFHAGQSRIQNLNLRRGIAWGPWRDSKPSPVRPSLVRQRPVTSVMKNVTRARNAD
jgi:hypothetical protein